MSYRWLAVLAMLTGGCAASYAPVVEYNASGPRGGGQMSSRPSQITQGSHVVVRGDTLFSIAWRYGWDYRQLAAANGIRAPFTIHPGQRIHLDRQPQQQVATPTPSTRPPASQTPPPATRPSQPPQPSPPVASAPAPSQGPSAGSSTPSGTGPVTWRWPANGQVISTFSQRAGQRGISIAGRDGDPVLAASDGVVVYRGNGLTGYGNLLIIKHNDRWLSAYAHNDEMLVREGEPVRAGQRIATMGATGTFRTQLHFEVRRDGQPVDPGSVLPRRS